MPDVKKVVKGIMCCWMPDECEDCDNCPYVDKHDCCWILKDDTLALLTEQEAVEPQIAPFPDTSRSDGSWYYVCGTCYGPIDPKDKYCRHCGKAVKWE